MAWYRPGDKSLSEPMVVSLPTHICVTGPQSVYKAKVFYEILSDIQSQQQMLFEIIDDQNSFK